MTDQSHKANGTVKGLLVFIALMQLVIFVFMLGLWSMTNDRIVDLGSVMASTITLAIKAFLGG